MNGLGTIYESDGNVRKKWKKKWKIEQNKYLLGFPPIPPSIKRRPTACRPLSDMISERANSLAVVEGLLSRFFLATAAARTIGHVCQARSVIQAEKGQRVPCNLPGEWELGIEKPKRVP